MSQAPGVNVTALWRWVTDQMKARTTQPALWRALEAAIPITVEGEELVIGYSTAAADQKGLLMDSRTQNTIEQVIEQGTRRRFRLRLIEGESLQDWEVEKQREVEGARLIQQSRRQYDQETAAGATWEAVGEQVIRSLSAIPNRALASVQGRFLEEAVTVLAEGYTRLMPEPLEEQHERSYSRVLERLSERLGVPSPIIAYLVHMQVKGGG